MSALLETGANATWKVTGSKVTSSSRVDRTQDTRRRNVHARVAGKRLLTDDISVTLLTLHTLPHTHTMLTVEQITRIALRENDGQGELEGSRSHSSHPAPSNVEAYIAAVEAALSKPDEVCPAKIHGARADPPDPSILPHFAPPLGRPLPLPPPGHGLPCGGVPPGRRAGGGAGRLEQAARALGRLGCRVS